MRKILLAFAVVAAAQAAPAAYAACAETHGGTAHVHSTKCPSAECIDSCPSLPVDIAKVCALLTVDTSVGVGFACD